MTTTFKTITAERTDAQQDNMKATVVGGPLEGVYTVGELWRHSCGKSEDCSDLRSKGYLCHRAELDNQPVIPGYLGPMWNGDGLRYETQEVYNQLSQ